MAKRNEPDTNEPQLGYRTDRGEVRVCKIEEFVESQVGRDLKGEVQLIFTSPPFILNRKKGYGNEDADAYKRWFAGLAKHLVDLLRPDGSIVIELGNSWVRGKPTMSTLPLEALIAFKNAAELELCQQFVWQNPAKLPSPAQWVNVERIRVKDSFTHIWWLSPNERPKANNRNVLVEYSDSMKKLLRLGKYNAGKRDSGWNIGEESFFTDNGGAIPPSVLTHSNTRSKDPYRLFCREKELKAHPATMPIELAEFFINFLTDPDDLVLDPFAGSNTTGAAAEALERRWMSIEPNWDYVDGSVGRFEEGVVSEDSWS